MSYLRRTLSQLDRLFLLLTLSYSLVNVDLTKGLISSRYSKPTSFALYLAYIFTRISSSAFYSIIIYPCYLDPLRHLPHPSQDTLFSRFFTEPTGPTHAEWLNTIPNQGLIRFYGRFNIPTYLVTTPSGCEEVLQTSAAHFPKQPVVRKILKMWLGPNTVLSTGDGEGHKVLRKRLLPAFYSRNIKELQPVFWEKANQMAEALHQIVAYNNDRVLEVDLDNIIDRAALDVVGLAGHGVDFGTLNSPGGWLGRLHKSAFDLGPKEEMIMISAILLPRWMFENMPFKIYRDNRDGVKALRNHTRAIIEADLSTLNKDNPIGSPSSPSTKSIVSMASSSSTFSIDDLVDLSMDLLVAGHKTVSSSLQLAFYSLAHHPDVQSRLREEILSTLPSSAGGAAAPTTTSTIAETISNLNIEKSLPYLTAVQNELLRLYPPVAYMPRRTIAPATISGRYQIPDGAPVVVSQWAMNRSEELWGSDADVFRPERWLSPPPPPPAAASSLLSGNAGEEEGSRKQKQMPSLLTFSRGPRNCIGEGFARKEVAILLARMVMRFEFVVVDEQKRARGMAKGGGGGGGGMRIVVDEDLLQGITVRVKGGCKVGVKELKR